MLRSLMAVMVLGASLTAFASSANAAGGEQGELLLRGPGSVYGQQESIATLAIAAGGSASFGFRVHNTGSATAQFNIQLSAPQDSCSPACSSTAVVTTGSLIVTPLTAGPNGYFTAPIAPGAVANFTLKITPSKAGTSPGDLFGYQLQLSDSAGTQLGWPSRAFVQIARNTGTGGADQFVSASGNPPTSGNANTRYGYATAPSVVVDQAFSFTVRLMNNGALPRRISYDVYIDEARCAAYFPIKVTQGSTDVTTAAQTGTYQTANLAHGASVTLTVKGVSLPGGAACLLTYDTGSADWFSYASNAVGDQGMAYLLFTPAAT